MLSDTLLVLIRSIGHLLPLPTTASIAGSSSLSTFELCSSKISCACLRLQLKHLCVPSKDIISLALMLASPRCWVFQQCAILTAFRQLGYKSSLGLPLILALLLSTDAIVGSRLLKSDQFPIAFILWSAPYKVQVHKSHSKAPFAPTLACA